MHALAPWELCVLVLVGGAAGFVNTVAGAGSLLSLRALMLMGLPAPIANGTNRIPILAQSLVASFAFRKAGKLPRAAIVAASVPACFGAAAGSVAASYVPDRPMRYVLIVVLFFVGVLGLRKSKRAASNEALSEEAVVALCKARKTAGWLFFAGAYGGFLQAGVGLVILYALASVGGLDLVRSNALKVVVVAIFSIVACGVFVARGQVVWTAAAAMACGSVVGARLAVAYALAWAERLKVFVVVVDVVACAALLGQEITSK